MFTKPHFVWCVFTLASLGNSRDYLIDIKGISVCLKAFKNTEVKCRVKGCYNSEGKELIVKT